MKSNLSINKDRRHPDILRSREFQRELLLWMYHPRDRVQTPTSSKTAFGSPEASLLVSKAKGVELCFSDRDEDGVGSGSGGIRQFTINSSLTLARVFFRGGNAWNKKHVQISAVRNHGTRVLPSQREQPSGMKIQANSGKSWVSQERPSLVLSCHTGPMTSKLHPWPVAAEFRGHCGVDLLDS